jgi:hypothetical protein
MVDCGTFACMAGACPTSCSTDAQCAAGYFCIGTTCQKKPQGAPCMSTTDCANGKCTDGVCCESNSCGKCKACNVAGFEGLCREVPNGTPDPQCQTDPVSSCEQDGKCDGAGSCRKYPAGTPCMQATCMGARYNPYTCDGAGSCLMAGGAGVSCIPYRCDPASFAGACFTSCTSSMQCASGYSCGGGMCVLQ